MSHYGLHTVSQVTSARGIQYNTYPYNWKRINEASIMPLKIISFEEAFTALRKLTSVKTLAADFSESISLETKCFNIR